MATVFVAIDTTDRARAADLAARVAPRVGGVKLGLEFYLAHGAAGVAAVRPPGLPLFLDLKLHDIPNTVAGAARAIGPAAPEFLTIHASGGAAMIRAARDAAPAGTRILAVTVLTSLDDADLAAVGQARPASDQVRRLAALARASGADGVVCAPHEVAVLRADLGPGFVLMVPGIRPAWAAAGDQKRAATPREAADAGADHLVVGRPITGADDPAAAAARIAAELA
jgi:orotidine-5'-phosphate decarboxylase